MKTTLEHEKIEQFLWSIPSFPKSIDESFFDEKEKFFIDLHRKELKEICGINNENNPGDDNVLKKLTEIVKELLFKSTNLEDSFKKYLEIEQQIECTSSGNQYLYQKQRALSVKALYYHKIKNYDKAFVFTVECIAIIEYLLKQGMYTLSARCFEQNKNISKVFFKSNQTELGNKTVKKLLRYLFNGEYKDGLFGNIFSDSSFWNKNPDIRESFAYETFLSVAEDMIKANLNNRLDFLPNEWNIDLNFEIDNPNKQILYNWITVNKHLKNLNYQEYFDSLTSFFKQPCNKDYDILKISLLIDFTKLVSKTDFENMEFVMQNVNDFFTHKIISSKSLSNVWISNHPFYNRARVLL